MPPRPSKRRRQGAAAAADDVADDEDAWTTSHAAGCDVPVAYAPAYALSSAPVSESSMSRTREGGGSKGPQCSQHPDDFCFFCAYERDPNAEAGSTADLYGSLVDLVNSMSRQEKEFPAIVDAVAVAYEKQIRPYVDDPDFGSNPEWLSRSIERHLTFSNQFGEVFDSAVTQVFHSLVAAQNQTVVDATTGHIIEENRAALMNTLDHYMKWQRFQANVGSGKKKAKGKAAKER